MTTANIVSAWQDANYAYLSASVAVTENGSPANIEYVAKVPLAVNGVTQTLEQLQTALTAQLQSLYTSQQPLVSNLGISGTVSI
jgi:hypothetical protein